MSDSEFGDSENENNFSQYSDEVNSDIENELYNSIYFCDRPTANDLFDVTYGSGLDTSTSFTPEKSLNKIRDKSGLPLKEFLSNNSIIVPNEEVKHSTAKKSMPKCEKTIIQVADLPSDLKNDIKKSASSKNHENTKVTESEESDGSSVLYFNQESFEEIDMVMNVNETLDNSNEVLNNSSNESIIYLSDDNNDQVDSPVEEYTEPIKKCTNTESITKRTFSASDWKSITISNEDFSDNSSSNKLSKSLPLKLKKKSVKVIKDLWHIDVKDRVTHKKFVRFFNRPKCDTCKKEGHKSKVCPMRSKKCYICGGDHMAKRCNKRVCSFCLSLGHCYYQCPRRYNTQVCSTCRSASHFSTSCPDLWRRFHATTSFGNIVRSQNTSNDCSSNFCYNCGRQGHLGYYCLEPKPNGNSLSPLPYVVSYDDPGSFTNSCRYGNYPSRLKSKPRKKRKKQNVVNEFYASTPVNSSYCGYSEFSPANSTFARKRSLFYEEQYFQRTPNNHLEVTEKSSKKKRKSRNRKKKRNLEIMVSRNEHNAYTC